MCVVGMNQRDNSSIDSLGGSEMENSPRPTKAHIPPTNLSHDSGLCSSDNQLYDSNAESETANNAAAAAAAAAAAVAATTSPSHSDRSSNVIPHSDDGMNSSFGNAPVAPPRRNRMSSSTTITKSPVRACHSTGSVNNNNASRHSMNYAHQQRMSTDSLGSVEENPSSSFDDTSDIGTIKRSESGSRLFINENDKSLSSSHASTVTLKAASPIGQVQEEDANHEQVTIKDRSRSIDTLTSPLDKVTMHGGRQGSRSSSLQRKLPGMTPKGADIFPGQIRKSFQRQAASVEGDLTSVHSPLRPSSPPPYHEAIIRRRLNISEKEANEQRLKGKHALSMYHESEQLYKQSEESRQLPSYEQAMQRNRDFHALSSPSKENKKSQRARRHGHRSSDTQIGSSRSKPRNNKIVRSKSDSSEHMHKLLHLKTSDSTDSEEERSIVLRRFTFSKSAERSTGMEKRLSKSTDCSGGYDSGSDSPIDKPMQKSPMTLKNKGWHIVLQEQYGQPCHQPSNFQTRSRPSSAYIPTNSSYNNNTVNTPVNLPSQPSTKVKINTMPNVAVNTSQPRRYADVATTAAPAAYCSSTTSASSSSAYAYGSSSKDERSDNEGGFPDGSALTWSVAERRRFFENPKNSSTSSSSSSLSSYSRHRANNFTNRPNNQQTPRIPVVERTNINAEQEYI